MTILTKENTAGLLSAGVQIQPSEGAFADGDKTKLDGIEAIADVTDTANVTAAGALMDSEVTDLAGIKALDTSTLQVKPTEGAFANGDKTKLDSAVQPGDVIPVADGGTGLSGVGAATQILQVNAGATALEYVPYPTVSAGWAQTAEELAASVTVVDSSYPQGNVKRYGAVGDGVANDQPAIQAAINLAMASGISTGIRVILPAGVYRCTTEARSGIILDTWDGGYDDPGFIGQCDLIGEGYVKITTAINGTTIFDMRYANKGSTIKNIFFENTGVYSSDSANKNGGIGINGNNNQNVEDLWIENCMFDGFTTDIGIVGCRNSVIIGNKFLASRGRDGGTGTNAFPNIGIGLGRSTNGHCENLIITNNHWSGYTGTSDIATAAPNSKCSKDGFIKGDMDGGLLANNHVEHGAYEPLINIERNGAASSVWTTGETYAVGETVYSPVVQDNVYHKQYIYICTIAGVAGATAPIGGGTVSDGGVTWAFNNYAPNNDALLITGNVVDCGVPTGMKTLNGTTDFSNNYGIHSGVTNMSVIGNAFKNCTYGMYLKNQSEHTINNIVVSGNTFQMSEKDYQPICAILMDAQGINAWAGTTEYDKNEFVTNGGNRYICTKNGDSAASGGPTGTGSLPITDGTCVWRYTTQDGGRLQNSKFVNNTVTCGWPDAFTADRTLVLLRDTDNAVVQNNQVFVENYTAGANKVTGFAAPNSSTDVTFSGNYVKGGDYAYADDSSGSGHVWSATNEWETISGFSANALLSTTAYAPATLTATLPAATTIAALAATPMIGQKGLVNNGTVGVTGAVISGTGAATFAVYYDGTDWRNA